MTKRKTQTKKRPIPPATQRYVGPFDMWCRLAERDRRVLARRSGR